MSIEKFANPSLLWLLLILVPLVGYYIFRTLQGGATITISQTKGVSSIGRTPKYYLRHLPFVLRTLAIALVIVALARPQSSESNQRTSTEGIDIVLSLDISVSMLARDFQPNRMEASKEVARSFILDRVNDRIGLVIFAGESYTQSPLTTDKATLVTLLSRVQMGSVDNGTAIGNGLATAVNRLKDSDAKSRVIILLTDGVNNRGQIAPLTAAEIAKAMGVRVYTIGMGTTGMAPSPAIDMYGNVTYIPAKVEIDEDVLTQIADMTGGKYFRATDNNTLKAVYEEINSLEKTKIDVDNQTRYHEEFLVYLLAALVLLILGFLTRYFYIRQIP